MVQDKAQNLIAQQRHLGPISTTQRPVLSVIRAMADVDEFYFSLFFVETLLRLLLFRAAHQDCFWGDSVG